MKAKMYTDNQMQLFLKMTPKLKKLSRQGRILKKYLIVGEFSDNFD